MSDKQTVIGGVVPPRQELRVAVLGAQAFGVRVLDTLAVLGGNVNIVMVGYPAGDENMLPAAEGSDAPALLTLGHWDKQPWQLEMLLRQAKPDVIVVAGWDVYLTQVMREIAPTIAYHPSLLPRHRGPNAVKRTIACGDPIAGGTVYLANADSCAGPIIAQQWCHVSEDWNASQLEKVLFPVGVEMLRDTVWKLSNGIGIEATMQDEQFATYEGSSCG